MSATITMKAVRRKRRDIQRYSTGPSKRLTPTWLVGKKVRLRPIEIQDIPLLHRWRKASHGLEWLTVRLPAEQRKIANWLANITADPKRHAFIIQALTGNEIGIITLTIYESQARLAIGIFESRYWTQSYGAETVAVLSGGAFRVVPLERIELVELSDNVRAIRSYKRAGFSKEGILRHCEYGGQYRDMIVMSILREEWQRSRR